MSRNVLVVVHFDNARPDQGRKTLQDEVLELAKRAADRAVQYLAKNRDLLLPPGESTTPGQRVIERNHEDWLFNVQLHSKNAKLHLPPATFVSEPLTEQDVVGLFHQLSALSVFPGLKIYATSQNQTYDSLVLFECPADTPGLRYSAVNEFPLGLSTYVIGAGKTFHTPSLTLEYKSKLDALISDIDEEEPNKSFGHIDICVCWNSASTKFKGYELKEITEAELDKRQYPGVTHVLHRDGDVHVIQVIMLERVVRMILAGHISLERATAKAGTAVRKK